MIKTLPSCGPLPCPCKDGGVHKQENRAHPFFKGLNNPTREGGL